MAMHRLEIGGGPSDLAGVEANQRQQDHEDQMQLEQAKAQQAAYEQQMHFNYQAQQAQQDQQYRQQALAQALGIHNDEFGRQQALDAQAAKQQGILADQGQQKITQAGQIAQSDQANKLQMEQERTAERDNASKLQAQSRSDMLTEKSTQAVEARRQRDLAVATHGGAGEDELNAINAKYDAMLPGGGGQQTAPAAPVVAQPVTNPVSQAQQDAKQVSQDAQSQAAATQQSPGNGNSQAPAAPAQPQDAGTQYMQQRDGLIAQREKAKASGDTESAQKINGQLDDLQANYQAFQAKHPAQSPDPKAALEPALTYGPNGWQTPAGKAKEAMQTYAKQLEQYPESETLQKLYNDAETTYQAEAAKQSPELTKAKQAADQATSTHQDIVQGLGAKIQAGGTLTPGQAAAVRDSRAAHDDAMTKLGDATGKPVLTPLEAAKAQLEAAQAPLGAGQPAEAYATQRAHVAQLTKAVTIAQGQQDKANDVQAKADGPLWNQETARIQKQLDDLKKNGDMASGNDADKIQAATDQLNQKIQTIATAKSTGVPFSQYQQKADKTDDLASRVVTGLENVAKMNKQVDDVTIGRGGIPKGSMQTQLSKLNEFKGVIDDDKLATKAMTLPAPSYLNNTLGVPVVYDPSTGKLKATGEVGANGYGAEADPAKRKENYELLDALISGDPYKYKNNGVIQQYLQQFGEESHKLAGTSQSQTESATASNKAGASLERGWITVPSFEAGESKTDSTSSGNRQIEVFKNPEDTFRMWGKNLTQKMPNPNDVSGLLQEGSKAIQAQPDYQKSAQARQQELQGQRQALKDKSDAEVKNLQQQLAKEQSNLDSWSIGASGSNEKARQNIESLKAQLKSRGAPETETETAISQAAAAGRGGRIAGGAAPDKTAVP